MRRLVTLLALAAAACTSPEPIDLPCSSDLHCAPGFHCDTGTGKCVKGEQGPSVEIKSPAEGDYLRGAVEIDVAGTDPDGVKQIEVKVGDSLAGVVNGDSGKVTFDTKTIADGAAEIVAVGTDQTDVSAGSRAAVNVNVDNTAPAITGLTVSPAFARNNTNLTITFQTSEEVKSTAVTVGGAQANFDPNGALFTYKHLVTSAAGAGTKTVLVEVADLAGNEKSEERTVTFDFTQPAFTNVTAAPNPAKLGATVTITFTASEEILNNPAVKVGTRDAQLKTKSGNNYVYEYVAIAADTEGTPTAISITGADRAGNNGTGTGQVTFDFTAPTVASWWFDPATAGPGAEVTIAVLADETLASPPELILRHPGGAQLATLAAAPAEEGWYNAFYTVSGDEDEGAGYLIDVRLVDAAGNEGKPTLDGSLLFDFTAPSLDADGMVYRRERTGIDELVLYGGATEPGAAINAFLDANGNFGIGSGAVEEDPAAETRISLPTGTHSDTIYVRATDPAGNKSALVQPLHRVVHITPAGANNTLVTARTATQGALIPRPSGQNANWFSATTALLTGIAAAQDGQSLMYTTSGLGPPDWLPVTMLPDCANANCGFTHDAKRNRFVMLVYSESRGEPQTWELDAATSGAKWTLGSAGGDTPYPRPLAYDTVRERVVAYDYDFKSGGGNAVIRTWNGTAWSATDVTGTGPGDRSRYTLVYDPTAQRLIVAFGEGNQSGNRVEFGDAWFYNHATNTFTAATGSPPARTGAAGAYDPGRQGVLFVGGSTSSPGGSGDRRDVWQLKSGAFTQVVGSLPNGFDAFNPSASYVGSKSTFVAIDTYGELFQIGASVSTYAGLGVLPQMQSQRSGRTFIDTAAGPILFGGWTYSTNANYSNNLWRYQSNAWTAINLDGQPNRLRGTAMTWDPTRQEIVAFGGRTDDFADPYTFIQPVNDLWRFKGGQWSLFLAPQLPSYQPPAVAYSSAGPYQSTIAIHGGQDAGSTHDFVATYDGSAYQQFSQVSPVKRSHMAVGLRAPNGQLLLFGGRSPTGAPFGDTYTWNGSSWNLLVTPTPRPQARWGATLVLCGATPYLFGGYTPAVAPFELNDLWRWDGVGARWVQVGQSGGQNWPAPRYLHSAYWDPQRSRMVVYGGRGANGATLSDLWEYDPANVNVPWAQLTTSTTAADANEFPPLHPGGRSEHAMAFDDSAKVGTLFAGYADGRGRGDTWRLAHETHGRVLVSFNILESAIFGVVPEFIRLHARVARGAAPSSGDPGVALYMPRNGRTWEVVAKSTTHTVSDIEVHAQYTGGDFFDYFSENAVLNLVFAPVTPAPGLANGIQVDFVEVELGYQPCPVGQSCLN
jgi:hypothetical protein